MTARFLERQTYPHREIVLRILTTSRDVAFQDTVRSWLAGCDYPAPSFDVVDFAAEGLADRPRPESTREVREVYARIYQHLATGIVTSLVFTLEDDILPPDDIFSRLAGHLSGTVASASGLYHGRYLADLIAWNWSKTGRPETLAKAVGVQNVGGHGFGAAVFSAEVFQPERFCPPPASDDFDYHFFRQIVFNEGHFAVLDADYLCRHHTAAGQWVQTPESALALRRVRGARTRLSIVHLNAYDHHGGAERLAESLLTSQRRDGHHSLNLVGHKTRPDSDAVAFSIEPDHSRREQLLNSGWPDYQFLGSHRLPENPSVREADVIHLHNTQGGYFHPFSLLALSQSRPVIWSIHDMHPITGYCSQSLACRRWQDGCGNCPDLTLPGPILTFDNTAALWRDKKLISDNSRLWIVGPSDWMVNNLRQSLLSGHPIRKIPNGIDTQIFCPFDRRAARLQLGLPPDVLIIGSLARSGVLAHPWKGGAQARRALAAVRQKHPDLIFLNLGCETDSDEEGIRNFLPDGDEQLRQHLAAADIFLHPAIADTAPLAVLEAMACRLPVVAFAIGGIPDMVRHGQDGFLAAEGDVEAMAALMLTLAADGDLRVRMGISARERATENFDTRQMAAAYEELYHEAVVAHAGAALPMLAGSPEPVAHAYLQRALKAESATQKVRVRLGEIVARKKADEIRLRELLLHPWMRVGRRVHIFNVTMQDWLRRRERQLFPPLEIPKVSKVKEVLALVPRLLKDDWVRHQFPEAIGQGADGAFAQWLIGQLTKAGTPKEKARRLLRETWQHPATGRLLASYLRRPQMWRRYPHALLGRPDEDFAKWLQDQLVVQKGVSDVEVDWFVETAAEKPVRNLGLSYFLQPEWQKAFPLATSNEGALAFLTWLRGKNLASSIEPEAFVHETADLQALSSGANLGGNVPNTPGAEGCNMMGHFCYAAGLGEIAFQYVRTAREAGFAVSLRDIPVAEGDSVRERLPYLGQEIFPVTIAQVTPSNFYQESFSRAGLYRKGGVHRIAVCWWELPSFPDCWLTRENWTDEIWAPTRFIQEALERAGLRNTRIVLPSVGLSPFPKLQRSDFGLPEDRTIFLFTFDMRSSHGRKNPHGVIRAFRMAFPDRQQAPLLVIKVSKGQRDPRAFERLREATNGMDILLIDEVMTRERSYALLDVADCYVSLHRSEGLGLGLAESMLMGKPVIGTNYSGNCDFMNAGNSLLVESKGFIEVGDDAETNYPRSGLWADPDLEQAAAHLRWIAEHPGGARALGEKARLETSELFSMSAAAGRMRRALANRF